MNYENMTIAVLPHWGLDVDFVVSLLPPKEFAFPVVLWNSSD